MNDAGFSPLLLSVIRLARDAGKLIMTHYDGPIVQSLKEDDSPLTRADLESQALISSGLKRLDPDVPVISEEEKFPDYPTRRAWRAFWLVDPLDGTKEFIKRNGEFTVNIARVVDGTPELGVIYAPALDLLYFAEKGKGAHKQESGEKDTRRIYSNAVKKGEPARIVESRSHPSTELEEYLKTIKVSERVGVGSSLKFGYIAEGLADVYPRFGPTMEWDVAAGDAIFRESGRQAPRRSSLTYNKEDLRNPNFILGFD